MCELESESLESIMRTKKDKVQSKSKKELFLKTFHELQSNLSKKQLFVKLNSFKMSKNGVWQLKSLVIHWHKHGGSSVGVRDFVNSNSYFDWKKNNPQFEVFDIPLIGVPYGKSHPYILAKYVHGESSQITIKNLKTKEILEKLDFFRNRWGFTKTGDRNWNQRNLTNKPSIQGKWSHWADYTK